MSGLLHASSKRRISIWKTANRRHQFPGLLPPPLPLLLDTVEKENQRSVNRITHHHPHHQVKVLSSRTPHGLGSPPGFWLSNSGSPPQRGRTHIQPRSCRTPLWEPDKTSEKASVLARSPAAAINAAPGAGAQTKPASLPAADGQLLLGFSFHHGSTGEVEVWPDPAHRTAPEGQHKPA